MNSAMNTDLDDFDGDDDLAGQYVLGTLSVGERRRVELAMPHESALRAAVQAWEARLLPLTGLAEPVAPTAALWSRIEASIAPAPVRASAERTRARWWETLGFWRTLAATGFASAALLLIVPRVVPPAATPRFMVVLAAPGNMAPGWIVQASASGAIRLAPLGSTPVAPGKSLQLWTKADGWKGPVSLGLVEPGKPLEIKQAALPAVQPNQLFEITLEPQDGSPIGRPTGPILYIGRAVQLL